MRDNKIMLPHGITYGADKKPVKEKHLRSWVYILLSAAVFLASGMIEATSI